MLTDDSEFAIAHEIWAAAQLLPGEGIEDGAKRIAGILARIDAERGKEAIGTLRVYKDDSSDTGFAYDICTTMDKHRTIEKMEGAKLFISPTIPEGMVLVPVEPSAAYLQAIRDAISYAKRISADEAGIVHQAVIAATQGEHHAD